MPSKLKTKKRRNGEPKFIIRIEFINTTLKEKENNHSQSFEIQFTSNNKERELYYLKS